jgi:hypothetical protein
LLEHAHRIGRAEHRHGARQANAPSARRGGRQDHRRCRVEELLAMVLADAEHVESDLIGTFDLVEQIAHALRRSADGTRVV